MARQPIESDSEKNMRWLPLLVVGLCAAALLHAPADKAYAQPAYVPDFVPGELIVGYESTKDRDDALQEMRGGKRVNLRGEPVPDMQVKESGETRLIIRVGLPSTLKQDLQQGDNGDRARELALLKELARQLRESDRRVKFAHPNWILGIDPPGQVGDGEMKLQSFEVDSELRLPGGAPNDPLFVAGMQWDYGPPPVGMNAVGAWKLGATGSRDVVVAVLDTGILYDHEDMKTSNNLIPGYNFVTFDRCLGPVAPIVRSADATDPGDACAKMGPSNAQSSWHGTHVAGTIGGAGTNNAIGIAGIARNVTVLPVRVLGRGGGGPVSDIVDALKWAAGLPVSGVPANAHPADVINMSLGGQIPCTEDNVPELIEALKAVEAAGTVVVASAGNGAWEDAAGRQCNPKPDDTECKFSPQDVAEFEPAGCPGVISVAASGPTGEMAPYSNYGAVSIMAPGGDVRMKREFDLRGTKKTFALGVWSTAKDGYRGYNGTSQAAPHVSGAIALALAMHPEWRHRPDGPAYIKAMLQRTASPLPPGACPTDRNCGPGLLDAAAFVGAQWKKSPIAMGDDQR